MYPSHPLPPLPPPHTHTHTQQSPKSSPGSDLPFTVPYPPLKEDEKSNTKKREEKGKKSHKKQKEEERVAQHKPPDEPRYHVLHRDDLSMQDFTNTRDSTLVRRPRELVVTVELPKVVTGWRVRVWRVRV